MTTAGRKRQVLSFSQDKPMLGLEFVAGLAHDMRGPLSAISSSADLLEQEIDRSTYDHLIEIIQRQTSRLQRMIQDLADYSVQAQEDRSNPELVDLQDLVRNECEEFQLFETSHR